MRLLLRLSGLVLIGALLVACGANPQINQITVTLEDAQILVGESTTASVQVQATGGANQDVSWTSTNNNVANITTDGLITAKAPGTTQIVATSAADSTKTDSATLTVLPQPAVTSVAIEALDPLYVGGNAQATANVTAIGGADTSVTWSVSDSALAEVHDDGLVSGVAVGILELTATSDFNSDVSDTVTIEVLPAPAVETISVTISNDSLEIGESTTATATVTVISGADNAVTWTVADDSIAEVNEDGLVTALAAGATDVIATSVFDASKSGRATLTVLPPPPELQLWRCDSLSGCDSTWREPEQVTWPYSYTSQSMISTTGSTVTLGSYILRAITDEYTITNVTAQDTSGRINPTFIGLSSGTVIRPGEEVRFTLISPRTGGLQLTINFTFEVSDNGDTFTHTAILRTN